jgi:hypothetical protein
VTGFSQFTSDNCTGKTSANTSNFSFHHLKFTLNTGGFLNVDANDIDRITTI